MPKGLRILHLSLGERNLTHFGGIFLIHQFCKKLRLKWYLQKQVSFPQRSSYQVFVTNLHLRAAIEVIIRELKESYALAKIPTNSFQANQFYFHLLLFAYNLVNWFKRLCLPPRFQNATLETIRTEFLVLPARLVKTDHQNILKLPSEYISKTTLDHIIQNISKMKPL